MKIVQMNPSLLYEGIMLEIWIPGCTHACDGCFNPELWDSMVGDEMSLDEIAKVIESKLKWISGVVLTGGDPLCTPLHTLNLINMIGERFPQLKIWMYTGYTKEEIDDNPHLLKIFKLCDVVITDRYDKTRPKTKLTGSDNQRVWRKDAE